MITQVSSWFWNTMYCLTYVLWWKVALNSNKVTLISIMGVCGRAEPLRKSINPLRKFQSEPRQGLTSLSCQTSVNYISHPPWISKERCNQYVCSRLSCKSCQRWEIFLIFLPPAFTDISLSFPHTFTDNLACLKSSVRPWKRLFGPQLEPCQASLLLAIVDFGRIMSGGCSGFPKLWTPYMFTNSRSHFS